MPDPKLQEKIDTTQKIIIPEFLKSYDLQRENVHFDDETITYLIQQKTSQEKGVRKLKQLIESIIKRIAYLKNTLLSLPQSAIWHTAWTMAQNAPNATMPPQLDQVPFHEEQIQKKQFQTQTSFYFPEFQLPIIVTTQIADKLLQNFDAEDDSAYRNIYI